MFSNDLKKLKENGFAVSFSFTLADRGIVTVIHLSSSGTWQDIIPENVTKTKPLTNETLLIAIQNKKLVMF